MLKYTGDSTPTVTGKILACSSMPTRRITIRMIAKCGMSYSICSVLLRSSGSSKGLLNSLGRKPRVPPIANPANFVWR